MFKTILTIKKRSDISKEEFISYYENVHLPLLIDLLPNKISFHRRNYITHGADFEYRGGEGMGGNEFDVITEAIYKSRKEAEQLTAMCREPDIYRRIIADESHFIEPGGVKKYIVETCETQISGHP